MVENFFPRSAWRAREKNLLKDKRSFLAAPYAPFSKLSALNCYGTMQFV